MVTINPSVSNGISVASISCAPRRSDSITCWRVFSCAFTPGRSTSHPIHQLSDFFITARNSMVHLKSGLPCNTCSLKVIRCIRFSIPIISFQTDFRERMIIPRRRRRQAIARSYQLPPIRLVEIVLDKLEHLFYYNRAERLARPGGLAAFSRHLTNRRSAPGSPQLPFLLLKWELGEEYSFLRRYEVRISCTTSYQLPLPAPSYPLSATPYP